MARITSRDCEKVVPNRYELVLLTAELAREFPDPSRDARKLCNGCDAKAVTALRLIAGYTVNPEILWINRWRRTRDLPLLGESNDNQPPVETTAGEFRTA